MHSLNIKHIAYTLLLYALSTAASATNPGAIDRLTPVFTKAALQHNLPVNLLKAIAILESKGNPWALNINGVGIHPKTRDESALLLEHTRQRPWLLNIHYAGDTPQMAFFQSRKQAQAGLRDIQANMRRWRIPAPKSSYIRKLKVHSVDIGIMQINHLFHGRHFEDFTDMLDPETNISYGARYLAQLMHRHGTLEKAVAHYHSGTPKYQKRYLKAFRPIYRRLNTPKT